MGSYLSFSSTAWLGTAWPGLAGLGKARQGEVFKQKGAVVDRLIKASLLNWDHKLGRMADEVNFINIARMVEAASAGTVFPPPVVTDDGTNRIADGIHRWTVHNQTKGKDAEILCDFRKFADEDELFLFSVAANSAHGQQVTSFDSKKIILEAKARGISMSLLADAIKLPVATMEKMIVDGTGFYKLIPGGPSVPVPLKRTVAKRFQGREMSEGEYELAKRMGGLQPGYYIKQVIAVLELGDIVDLAPDAQENLHTLYDLLSTKLFPQKKRRKTKPAHV